MLYPQELESRGVLPPSRLPVTLAFIEAVVCFWAPAVVGALVLSPLEKERNTDSAMNNGEVRLNPLSASQPALPTPVAGSELLAGTLG
jgi:hypothetical protein